MSTATSESWVETTFRDVTDYISRGKSPKYAEFSGLPVVNQKAIRWHGLQNEHLKYIHPDQVEQWTPERFIQEGDVLWNSTGTGTIGRACLVKKPHLSPPKVVDSHVTIVRPNKEIIDPRYLFAWIRSPEIQGAIADLSSGSTNQIELNRNTIAETRLPLAPLNEQKRIADKLDSLLTRVDACRERLERVPQILKRFRQAVLAAATSGALTEEWREECSVFSEWSSSELGDIAFVTKLAGFEYTKYVTYREGGDLRVIKAENAGKWGFKYTDFSTVCSEEVSMLTRSKLQEGDVLMVFVGAGTGQVARVPSGDNWFLGPNIAMIRTESNILNPAYLEHYCRSPMGVDEISKFIKSVAQPSLSMKTIRLIQIPLPTIEEQNEIVRRIETLFAFADRVEDRYASARAQVDQLTPSLLYKAFRGELVLQDPNDEPAEKLLERILSQIMQPTKRKRTRTLPERKQSSKKSLHERIFELFGLKEFDSLMLSTISEYDALKDSSELYDLLDRGIVVMTLKDGKEGYSIRCVSKPKEVKQ